MSSLPIQPPGNAPETLLVEPGRCLWFAHKNISIAVWIGQADLSAAEANERAARMMARRYRDGRSYIAFILDGVPGPTPDAVTAFAKQMSRNSGLACMAYVMEGSGFWASGLRSMINNAYRDSGSAARIKVGTSPDEVAEWLSAQHEQLTSVAIPAPELLEALRGARAIAESARG